jgi:hypothetical protein
VVLSDEIVKPIVLHVCDTYCDDLMDGVMFSSYHLNVSYIFIGMADRVLHPSEVYPKLVKLDTLADLVNNFCFLTVNEMKSVCSAHGLITEV